MKALLLDLDGTLINSEYAFSRCFVDYLNKNYNTNFTLLDYKKYELEQNAMLIKHAKELGLIDKNIDDEEIMKEVKEAYKPYFREIIKEDEAIENFKLIRELKKDYLIGLITTCRRECLDILDEQEKIYDTFDIVIAREDLVKEDLKPNPKAYLMALEKLGLDSSDAIAIEDSPRGVEASIRANIKTIKVDNFSEIKEQDPRCIKEESANKALKKMLHYKQK